MIFEYCPKCENKWEIKGEYPFRYYRCPNCWFPSPIDGDALTQEQYDYIWRRHRSAELYHKDKVKYAKCGEYLSSDDSPNKNIK